MSRTSVQVYKVGEEPAEWRTGHPSDFKHSNPEAVQTAVLGWVERETGDPTALWEPVCWNKIDKKWYAYNHDGAYDWRVLWLVSLPTPKTTVESGFDFEAPAHPIARMAEALERIAERIEGRKCRECDGAGRTQAGETCFFCCGRGKLSP